jgi:hypothetical protein
MAGGNSVDDTVQETVPRLQGPTESIFPPSSAYDQSVIDPYSFYYTPGWSLSPCSAPGVTCADIPTAVVPGTPGPAPLIMPEASPPQPQEAYNAQPTFSETQYAPQPTAGPPSPLQSFVQWVQHEASVIL